jgi:hypothetical protein
LGSVLNRSFEVFLGLFVVAVPSMDIRQFVGRRGVRRVDSELALELTGGGGARARYIVTGKKCALSGNGGLGGWHPASGPCCTR